MSDRHPSICFTLTSPFVLSAFLLGHIRRLSESADITICVNRSESDIAVQVAEGAVLHPVEIRRKISPVHDALALFTLWSLYRKRRFSAVLTVTPKGGLLGMVAARLADIPVRIHWFTGQVWATKKGPVRMVLKCMDRLIAACATHVLADSPSQKDFLIAEGIVGAPRIQVLGDGSISGVDASRFKPDPAMRAKIRAEFGIPPDSPCLLYVGRMKREKGIADLLAAFRGLREEFHNLHMVLVGPDEECLLASVEDGRIHVVGYAKEVENYMAAADLFCLPSYREGFGSVLIEAAAAGVPSVASRIYGITDAIVDGETGLLHEPGNPADLSRALKHLLQDVPTRNAMAKAARLRSLSKFSSRRVEDLFAGYLMKKM